MPAVKDKEIEMLDKAAAEFAKKELAPNREENDKFPFGPFFDTVLQKAFELDFFHLILPEFAGGMNQGLTALSRLLENLCREDSSLGGIVFTTAAAQQIMLEAGYEAELEKLAGGLPIEIPCDVTRPEDLEAAAKRIQEQWGGLDILVNNAGVAAAGLVENTPLETWEWILALNTKSIFYGCRAFIPMLKAQGAGYIVNMASAAGIASLPEMACYNVTKAAAISLTETLRAELAPFHIGVSVICPTFFKTNLMDQFTSPDAQQREMANAFFSKSRYTPENIARHVVRSINRNRFYILTQRDARLAWHLKRFFAELYFRVVGFIYRTRLYKRYLGI